MHRLSSLMLTVLVSLLTTASPSSAAATAAYIATIAPAVASYGESVSATGIGFGGPGVIIRVDGVVAPVVSATGTRVTFRVPMVSLPARSSSRPRIPGAHRIHRLRGVGTRHAEA